MNSNNYMNSIKSKAFFIFWQNRQGAGCFIFARMIFYGRGRVMDFRQIKCFLSVANLLNFTNAARECFISQQSLSQQISMMENELGFSLFTRNNRAVSLTSAGLVFLEEAKHISALYDKGVERSRAAAAGTLGSLSVGYDLCFHHLEKSFRFHKI